MMLYEEGAFELTDPVSAFIPSFDGVRVYAGGPDAQAGYRARHRAGADLAPAHAHGGPHLRLPPGPPGGRDVPERRVRVDLAGRARPGRLLRRLGRAAAAVPAGHRVELLGGHRRAGPGGRGRVRAAPGRVLRQPHPGPAGHDRHRVSRSRRRRTPPGWPPCTRRTRRTRPVRNDALGAMGRSRPRWLSGGGGAGLHRRRLSPVHPDAAAPPGQPGRGAGRRPAARPAHGRLHGPQPPAGRRRPGNVRPPADRRGPAVRRRASASASPS